jgi:hypothetical protein
VNIAFAILAHRQPEQIAELAQVLACRGDSVVIHYDANSPESEYRLLRTSLAGAGSVTFADRVRCGWGEFSLVQATMNCLEDLRRTGRAVDYVFLLSGADIPIKPLAALKGYLSENAGGEFIESFPIRERRWLLGGNQEERFLYRFPFNKRRFRRLFRAFLLVQRWLRLTKAVPPGLKLCLGSQFWCLTWESCEAILRLCEERPEVVRFFRTAWIPDESFFQTLIRNVAPAERIRGRSLTHYHFDEHGRPRAYADGDQAALETSDAFFARKAAGDARELRRHFFRVAASSSDAADGTPPLRARLPQP